MDVASLARLCRLPIPDADPVGPVLEYMERIGDSGSIEPLHLAAGPAREDEARVWGGEWGPYRIPAAGS